jgi:hypothetical protein
MSVALGRQYVAAPPFAPHRFGLFSVVDQPATPDAHWRAGVESQPNPCDEAGSTVDDCPSGVSPTKAATADGFDTLGAQPFTVFAMIPCSPVGMWPELEARTVSALTNGEGRAVERVLWTGAPTVTGTVYPHLANNTEVVEGGVLLNPAATVAITGTPAIVRAVGALEGALGECYGGEGVIHVPMAAVAHLAGEGLLVRDGDRLRTWAGNRVAVYASGNREGPTGVAPADPDVYWLYATGAISMRRTGIESASRLADALDRSNNTASYIAERTYVLNWDCCLVAVQTDLST